MWVAQPSERDAVSLSWLDDTERTRLERLRFERDRRVFLTAHALVRAVLAHYLGAGPGSWRFTTDARGRPHAVDGLPYSLSHTHECAACAVSWSLGVGVDVEDTSRTAGIEIARSHFAPSEYEALAALAGDAQRRRFFELWTLKEAYSKALGVGLARPLDSFAFQFRGSREPRLEVGGEQWRFLLFQPAPGIQGALAARPVPREIRIRAASDLPEFAR